MCEILTLDTIVLEGIFESPTEDSDSQEDAEGYWPRYRRGLDEWFLRTCPGADKELNEFMKSYVPEPDTDDDFR